MLLDDRYWLNAWKAKHCCYIHSALMENRRSDLALVAASTFFYPFAWASEKVSPQRTQFSDKKQVMLT